MQGQVQWRDLLARQRSTGFHKHGSPGIVPGCKKSILNAASVGVSDSSIPSLTASAWMCLPIRQRARVEARESTATKELECEGQPAVR